MSPANTTYDARSLPPGKQAERYGQYRVLKEFQIVKEEIAPAFGKDGSGVQLRARIPEVKDGFATVEQLIEFK